MKHLSALSFLSTSLLLALTLPSSSHASDTTGEVDFQAGVTTLVAEGGAFPVASLGLRTPIGSLVDLELRLDTIGIAGALQAAIDVSVVRSENGHHSLGLRATTASAYAADFFGGTLVVAMLTGGATGSIGSRDIRTSLSVEAGVVVGGILGSTRGSELSEPANFVLRPELSIELFADEEVRPFLGVSAFINPEFLLGAATLGVRW